MRVCVTGGHDFKDEASLIRELDSLWDQGVIGPDDTYIDGMAAGVDTMFNSWVKSKGVSILNIERKPANWNKYRKKAGPIRNCEMLFSGIDLLLSFPGNNGTAHMTRICSNAGVRIIRILKD